MVKGKIIFFCLFCYFSLFFLVEVKNVALYEQVTIEAVFCSEQNCSQIYTAYLGDAQKSIQCAFYDLDLNSVIDIINTKQQEGLEVDILLDDNNAELFPFLFTTDASRKGWNRYMHNKYCVIDQQIVITGSTNPTYNGVYKNDNDIVIIDSSSIAERYSQEFDELYRGVYGKSKQQKKIEVMFENMTVATCFSPQEDCLDKIAITLEQAQESIIFAQFVMTDDRISEILDEQGKRIHVEGVLEKRMRNVRGSDAEKLSQYIEYDDNKATMHHKFFVIDNETVITGSMNPSKSGGKYNDENIVMIKDKKLANQYTAYFNRLRE